MNLPFLRDAGNLRGKRVLLRLDLNVPIQKGVVVNAYRIERVSKTLQFLKDARARTLIVSHLESAETKSLRPVFKFLSRSLPLIFAENMAEARKRLAEAEEGTFVLLENIRRWDGEKSNDPAFAKELASLADCYTNDAFAVSHRAHASIVGAPRLLKSFAGFLFEEEVENLSKAFSPPRPFLVILGGAKFETKLPFVKRFLEIADEIFVGGALANDIYKARGYEVGVSLVSGPQIESPILENPKLQAPVDVVVNGKSGVREKAADNVTPGEKIVDAGENALGDLRALIEKSKFVLWNGPLGEYEAWFDAGTVALAQELAECDAETIIGGGDSLAVAGKLGLLERFSFVSTGGGAMLEFLANGTLLGIEAIKNGIMNYES